MDGHRKQLQRRCRVCSEELQDDRCYSKSAVSLVALGIDIAHDDDQVHPQSLCGSCYRKLRRWKDAKNKKRKTMPLNITLHAFIPHGDECTLCKKNNEPDITEVLLEAVGQLSSLAVQKRANRMLVVSLDDDGNTMKVLTVKQNGMWCIKVYGKNIDADHPHFTGISNSLMNAVDAKSLVNTFSSMNVCPGNPEYANLSEEKLKTRSVYRHNYPNGSTIRHIACPLLTPENRCGPCSIYRSSLAAAASTCKISVASTSTRSRFTPFQHLPPDEVKEKLRQSQISLRNLKRRVKTLEDRIASSVKREAEELTRDQSDNFSDLINNNTTTQFFESLSDDSPQKILWQQQKKSSTSKPTAMRWHPSLLRMCIALNAKSSSAYKLLRNSGFMNLPHQNTLKNYTHFTDTSPGFNTDLLAHIIQEQDLDNQPNYKRNVCLLMDEMKIKSGLVFSGSGRLVGFCDLGDINNELKTFEETLKGDRTKLATHVFVLMARGLFSGLKAPIAYFPCSSMSSEELYSCVWEGVQLLEAWGLQVRSITSDGASSNRKFYTLCCEDAGDHWTRNPFARDRKVYFMSDVPHLLKTLRNNIANSGCHTKTRNLMFRGKQISWRHFLNVVEWDRTTGSGLHKLYRISSDHLHLTPTSRMRVSLAAQVLSSTMANALESQGLEETESTRYFVRMVDVFFDSLNVSTLFGGQKKKKVALEPYTSVDDWRFLFLKEDFLSFLDEWETEGMFVPGLSKADRGKLCLSKATLDGLRMTVNSFTALAEELLAEEGVKYLLSEKFSQDPLEEHFGKQRGMGGRHENPDAKQFGDNMTVLQVAGSCIASSAKANVKRQSEQSPIKTHPLPKRQKKSL